MNCINKIVRFSSLPIALGLVLGNVQSASGESSYAPTGIHAGSFYFFPVVEIGIGYDDNVFRLPDDVTEEGVIVDTGEPGGPPSIMNGSDTRFNAHASVTMNSDWNRHALNGLASIDVGKYKDLSSEDFGNYNLALDGRLDVKRGNAATARVGTLKRNEDRSAVNSREAFGDVFLIYGDEPTQYHLNYVGVGYNYKPARLGVAVNLNYETLEYEDVTNIFGQNIDNGDRDRSRPDAVLRVGYEVMPQRSVYVQGNVFTVDYDRPVDNNGIERSSTGYKATAGMHFDLSNLLLGDVYVGYLEQNYDSATQADISSNVYGAGLTWFPSRLTSVNFHLDRNVEESTEATVSGYLSTTASVGVSHELKRNIILDANADYTKNEFQQNVEGGKENEDITGFGLGGRYLISKRFYTSLRYRYETRESDLAQQEYTGNRYLLTLGANW